MQEAFNTLINSFIENKIGITDNFLGKSLSAHLKQNLTSLYSKKLLLAAGTGNNSKVELNNLFRSDRIYWLDRKHNDVHENSFFALMDHFVEYLNETCYTSISNYEFHYTLYEKGSFYKKHLDQFRNNESRKYSMVMYLNNDWKITDGGELCVYPEGKSHSISPISGKSVFFKSDELEHEVLVTHVPRMSITGWLKS
jgi:SM-20-related protein